MISLRTRIHITIHLNETHEMQRAKKNTCVYALHIVFILKMIHFEAFSKGANFLLCIAIVFIQTVWLDQMYKTFDRLVFDSGLVYIVTVSSIV